MASYLGETSVRLQGLFDYVRRRRCVLFFDEFDTLGEADPVRILRERLYQRRARYLASPLPRT